MLFTFLRYLHFSLDFLVMYKKPGLIRSLRLLPKFMTSQAGQKVVTIHILPNILRSKGNHAMKFGQLIEYYIRYIFLQKPCRKCSMETSSKPIFVF